MATIISKFSETSSSQPTTAIAVGELAINLADGKIYSKDSGDLIVNLSGAPEIHDHDTLYYRKATVDDMVITVSTTAPASPVTNQLWLDIT